MTAWMAGRSGPDGSLQLSVYRFPRQTSVFGPQQIEARVDQDPTISQQISLWNQSGSEVLQGSLSIIPVNETVLYIQPLYLRSTNGSSIPELRRVIVATEQSVYMAATLREALLGAVGGEEIAIEPDPNTGTTDPGAETDVAVLVGQANDAYVRGEEALASGDWVAYGNAQQDLKAILEQLDNLTNGGVSAPDGTADATPVP
jgi:uncharacterized membrane protein (UPF0182 family)